MGNQRLKKGMITLFGYEQHPKGAFRRIISLRRSVKCDTPDWDARGQPHVSTLQIKNRNKSV